MLRPAPRIALLLLGSLVALAGCSPTKYRLQADHDAYSFERESEHRAGEWGANYSIEPDPRSRMFDPFDPDHEPMPPDDPASHELMHYVDGKKGYKHWHKNGDTPFVENPDWMAYLCFDEEGCIELASDDAVRVALLHSREYQDQLEELYLSALDVSFERDRFDTQFFGGYLVQYETRGRNRTGTGESSSELTLSTFSERGRRLQAERLFATGGTLVVGLANSLIWEFSGPNDFRGSTLLDFMFVQPLLRGGGKAVNLERLTVAERTLLANVRQMERYRRGFYVQIMTGENAGQGPSRRGGLFGDAGLEGFTGIGGGGFGRIGGGGGNFNANNGFTGGAGAAAAGGYLGLLQEQQNIRNQEFNVTALQNSLLQLEELASSGLLTPLQVAQTRQALYNAQSRLLTSRTGYQSTLDRFKLVLGLPPELCIDIDDPLLDQFNLISPEMLQAQLEVTRLQQKVGETLLGLLPHDRASVEAEGDADAPLLNCDNLLENARNLALREEPPAAAPPLAAEDAAEPALVWTSAAERQLRSLQQDVARIEALRATLARETAAGACADIQLMAQKLPARLAQLEDINRQLTEEFDARDDDTDAHADELRGLAAKLQNELLRTVARIDTYQAALARVALALDELIAAAPSLSAEELSDRLGREVRVPLADLLREFSTDVLELTLIQARARTEAIDMVPVELEPEVAIQIAQANRRDWANARASLVDTWRLITFNANFLKAGLDVVVEGDLANIGENPLELRGSNGSLRARLEFDAPLERLAERNNYRQAQIEYQEARRNFYAFRDNVARGLRDTLRTIDLNRLNFELRRRAIVVAITQVDLARLRLQEPPKPVAIGAPIEVQTITDTAARDLVSALTDLLNAQNDFLSVWVNYEVQRRVLDFNLGTMQLDHDGLWVDPGAMGSETGFLLPADCDDCQLEAEIFGPLPSGIDSATPLDGDAEELPPGDVEEELPLEAAKPLVDGQLLHAELRVNAGDSAERNEVSAAGFHEEHVPEVAPTKKQPPRFRR